MELQRGEEAVRRGAHVTEAYAAAEECELAYELTLAQPVQLFAVLLGHGAECAAQHHAHPRRGLALLHDQLVLFKAKDRDVLR